MNISEVVTTELLNKINAHHASDYYAVATTLNHLNLNIPLYAVLYTTMANDNSCQTLKIYHRPASDTPADQRQRAALQLLINNDTIIVYDLSRSTQFWLSNNVPNDAPYTIFELSDPQSIPKALLLIKQLLRIVTHESS